MFITLPLHFQIFSVCSTEHQFTKVLTCTKSENIYLTCCVGLCHSDWYNLEKSKRVKSFRCGEYDECIEKAKALARQQKRTHTEGRYVRREDAIMHALEIERSRFPSNCDDLEEDAANDVYASQNICSSKSININGLSKKSHGARSMYDIEENSAQESSQALTLYKKPQNLSSSSTRYASSKRKKRKGHKDHANDKVQGFQRMRDLREIGTKNVPKQKSGAGIVPDVPLLESGPSFGYDLSSVNGIKKGKQSQSSIKKKRSNIGQSYDSLSKKDRHRHLSILCEDSEVPGTYYPWDPSGQSSSHPGGQKPNLFESSRAKNIFAADVNNCSYSSGTSSLETLLDTSHINHKVRVNAVTLKDADPCTIGFLNDDCPDRDGFLDAVTLEGDVLQEGKRQRHFYFPFWLHYSLCFFSSVALGFRKKKSGLDAVFVSNPFDSLKAA